MNCRLWCLRAVPWLALLAICLQAAVLQGDDELRASYQRRLNILANLHAEFTVEHHRVVPSEEELEAIRKRLPPRFAKKNLYPAPAEEAFSYTYRRGGESVLLAEAVVSSPDSSVLQIVRARTPYRSERLQVNKRDNEAFGRIADPEDGLRPDIFLEYAIGVAARRYPRVLGAEDLQAFTFQETEDGGIIKFSPDVRRHEWRVDAEDRITEYFCRSRDVTEIHIINSDFYEVGGCSLPRNIAVTESNGSRQEILVKSYSIKPPADDMFMITFPTGTRIEDQRTGYRFVKEGSSAVTESFLRDAAMNAGKAEESSGDKEKITNVAIYLAIAGFCVLALFAIVVFRRKSAR